MIFMALKRVGELLLKKWKFFGMSHRPKSQTVMEGSSLAEMGNLSEDVELFFWMRCQGYLLAIRGQIFLILQVEQVKLLDIKLKNPKLY